MDRLDETISTYEKNAADFAEYFRSVAESRADDINQAFRLLGDKQNPLVLEIGCADGRDAAEVVRLTTNYMGFDPVESFIEMAKQNVKGGTFTVGDARTFEYPEGIDIVFAFASLLHLNKEEVKSTFDKLASAVNPGGIVYISMKRGETYQEYIKEDRYGRRLFYLYTPQDIAEITSDLYAVAYTDEGFVTEGNTQWFVMALRRN